VRDAATDGKLAGKRNSGAALMPACDWRSEMHPPTGLRDASGFAMLAGRDAAVSICGKSLGDV
jgi:hypothetical protein